MPKPLGKNLSASASEGAMANEGAKSPVSVTKSIRSVREVQKVRNATKGGRKRGGGNVWTNAEKKKDEVKAVAKKSEAVVASLKAALKARHPFSSLEEHPLGLLIDAMVKVDVKANEVLVKEGDDGQECYIVESGSLTASVEGVEKSAMGKGQGSERVRTSHTFERLSVSLESCSCPYSEVSPELRTSWDPSVIISPQGLVR